MTDDNDPRDRSGLIDAKFIAGAAGKPRGADRGRERRCDTRTRPAGVDARPR